MSLHNMDLAAKDIFLIIHLSARIEAEHIDSLTARPDLRIQGDFSFHTPVLLSIFFSQNDLK